MSKQYATATLKVTPSTKESFERVAKGKTADETICMLLDTFSNYKKRLPQLDRAEQLERENIALKQQLQALPQIPAQASTTESQTEASKFAETTAPIEPVTERSRQCPFYRFDNKKQLVECDKDFITKNRRPYSITQKTCDLCWETHQSKKAPSLKSISETSLITDEQISKEEPAPAQNSPSGEQKPESKTSSENEKWTPAQAKQIELAYEIWMAREKAKIEGERERQRIKTEEQAKRRGNSQKKSTIDMGDSAGVSEEYTFRE